MYINKYIALSTFLIIQTLSFATFAKDISLRFRFSDTKETPGNEKIREYPMDIIRSIKSLNVMIEDLGGFKAGKIEGAIPLPTIKSWAFQNIVDILKKAKEKLNTNKGAIINPEFKLDEVLDLKFQDAINSVIYEGVRPSEAFYGLMYAANYLDVPAIVDAAATLWLKQYSEKATDFNEWLPDLKKVVISKLDPAGFISLMSANEGGAKTQQQDADEQNSYAIAFGVHYNKEKLRDAPKKQYRRRGLTIPLAINQPEALVSSGSKVFVGYKDNRHIITMINTKNDKYAGSIHLDKFDEQNGFVVNGNQLLVANSDGKINVVDINTRQVLEKEKFSAGYYNNKPTGLAIFDHKLFMTTSRYLMITNLNTKKTGNPIELGFHSFPIPNGLAVSFSKVFVPDLVKGTIKVIDSESNKVLGQPIKLPGGSDYLAVFGTTLFVISYDNRSVTMINTENDAVIGNPITLGTRKPVALAASESHLFVATENGEVHSFLRSNGQRTDLYNVGRSPNAMVVVGKKLYVANSKDNTISVIFLD